METNHFQRQASGIDRSSHGTDRFLCSPENNWDPVIQQIRFQQMLKME